jgi:Ca2+-binding RTX toxin-like protein
MKKLLFISLVFVLFIAQTRVLKNLVAKPTTVRAAGDLTIDWGVPEGQPIFEINNFLPGQTESRTVTVINAASLTKPIGVRGRKEHETKNLASALMLIISENGTDLYGGTGPTGKKTLAQFFLDSQSADGIKLSNLPAGQTTRYLFTVDFPPNSESEYQAATVIFDLVIGVSFPVPDECQRIQFGENIIFGTEKDDHLQGTNGNDLIVGLEGDDTIEGGNGDDCIVGGPGNDRLTGNNGDDILLGEEGNDRLNGGNGNDLLIGGPGEDTLDGLNGKDRMFGGPGNDRLDGGNENDSADGDEGDDRFYGGNGDDVLIGSSGEDWADGGPGTDRCETETRIKCETF